MRYEYHIHKDFGGIPAQDKETVMDLIRDGPKTTGEMSGIMGMDPVHTRHVVQYLAGIGAVEQVGRVGKVRVWGVKA